MSLVSPGPVLLLPIAGVSAWIPGLEGKWNLFCCNVFPSGRQSWSSLWLIFYMCHKSRSLGTSFPYGRYRKNWGADILQCLWCPPTFQLGSKWLEDGTVKILCIYSVSSCVDSNPTRALCPAPGVRWSYMADKILAHRSLSSRGQRQAASRKAALWTCSWRSPVFLFFPVPHLCWERGHCR